MAAALRPALALARELAAAGDLSLYLVTDSALAGGADRVPAVVAAAVRGGVRAVQVREKDAPDAEVAELVRAVAAAIRAEVGAERARRIPLVVNDRPAVAAELGCHLHLGQGDMPAAQARELIGDELMIGLSASDPQQVRAAIAEGQADLLGIGPIRGTATKPDAAAPLGLGGLAACLAPLAAWTSPPPAVAIGGIDAEMAGRLGALRARDAHLAGICAVSAIMAAPDPEAASRQLGAALERGRENP